MGKKSTAEMAAAKEHGVNCSSLAESSYEAVHDFFAGSECIYEHK